MVATGGNDATASDATAAAGAAPDASKVHQEEAVGKKRRTRPSGANPLSTSGAAMSNTADSKGEAKTTGDDMAAEDEAMSDAVAKMKENGDVEVNFEVAAPAEAAASSADDKDGVAAEAAASAASALAAASAAANGGSSSRLQLYDSKRMTRVSFSSWFDFDSYFEMYMQETFQPFRMRSSCSVEAYRRNQQKVMLNNKTTRGRRTEFPDEAIHHHRIYMCTHAMKARCRGATTRPGQKYRGIGCIAKINVKITPADNESKYLVIVTDQVVTHNHPVSREIYEAYPDVLLKMMRRSQLSQAMLGRQPSPKFETAVQLQKYERAMGVLNSVAEAMARLGDEDYEQQLAQLQRIYNGALSEQNTSSV